MNMKWVVFLSLFVLLTGCTATYKNVSVQELSSAKEPNYILLDVRQPEEYDEAHVANSVLIPLGELALRTSELAKDAPLYVICRSGNRSKQASDILVKAGFKDVRNVEGGILAWQAAGFAVE
jgi:rhodanese-related sulfurtransferase